MSMECCARHCFQSIKDFASRMYDFHKFPNNAEKALEYLEILDRKDLMHLPMEILRENYFFCDLHVCVRDEDEIKQTDDSRDLHSISSKENYLNHENVKQMEHEKDYYFDNFDNNAQNHHTFSNDDSTGSNDSDSKKSRFSEDYTSEDKRDINTSNADHKCKNCKLKFVSKERFRRHMFKFHGGSFCADCNKFFKSSYYLQTHKKEHCFRTSRTHY